MHTRLFIACLLAFATTLFADNGVVAPWNVPQFSERIWRVEQGLPRNTVQAIAQTPDGYLWIGTQSGLARFDGEEFEWITLPANDGQTKQWVNDLCTTTNGSLWIATGGRGLFEYHDGELRQFVPSTNLTGVILSIHETSKGLLCGTRRGLLRFDGKEFFPVATTNDATSYARRLAVTTIRSITSANDKHLVALPGEIVEVDGTNVTSKFDIREINPDTYVRCIYHDIDGTIWIGSNSGLTEIRGGHQQNYSKADGLPDDTVNAVYRDKNNNLWIGTYGGLCRFIEGKFVVTTADDGEPFDQAFCFFEDRENNLWVGGKDGLCQLRRTQFYTLTTRHGLAHNNVISVCEDKEKNLWVGTWGGGLQRLRGDMIETFSTANVPIFKRDLILALYQSSDNSLWVGTDYDSGLYRFNKNGFESFSSQIGFTNAIRAIIEYPKGKFWFGAVATGLSMYDGKKIHHYGRKDGITSQDIRCFCRTHDNVLWVGAEQGLFQYDEQSNHFRAFKNSDGLRDNFIFSLFEDSSKTLWVGTSEGGLHRFVNGKFKSYTTEQGLQDNTVLEILEDKSGVLWLSSFHGITAVSKSDFDRLDRGEISKVPVRFFDKEDGMRSSVCISSAKPAACRTSDGKLWFATTKGLCVTDPSINVPLNKTLPPVTVRRILAGKTEVPIGGPITIKAGHNDLEIQYAALSYTAPEHNSYKYKLIGYDNDWQDAQHRKVAFYNNLPPGSYRFQVIAANNDGVWNDRGAVIGFIIEPHLWQTMWFRAACILISLSLAGHAARIITKRRMQRRLRLLEQQHAIEKERSRIAQDMHDEVGAKLTKITFLGSVAKQRLNNTAEAEQQIENISRTARELIGALDEIVWAVDPKNDTLENFANYLCRHAGEFFESSDVLCELHIPTEVPHVSLRADVRHNLFLAVKESLNNVLKHSRATKVVVDLSADPRHVTITIRDNGVGLSSPAQPEPRHKRGGNGLRNMQHRLASIGGICDLQTSLNQGTTITFRVPIKQR